MRKWSAFFDLLLFINNLNFFYFCYHLIFVLLKARRDDGLSYSNKRKKVSGAFGWLVFYS